jgi:hypothetical protein
MASVVPASRVTLFGIQPVAFVGVMDHGGVGVTELAGIVASGVTVRDSMPFTVLDHICRVVGGWVPVSSIGHVGTVDEGKRGFQSGGG